ncbi:hypothetical protein [Alkalihalobacillus deserti]|nr:hypothetical protein [Alkalihalobacillus deserti]
MRAYSERNLIGQELNASSFYDTNIRTDEYRLRLMLPRDIYFRAQVLCDY